MIAQLGHVRVSTYQSQESFKHEKDMSGSCQKQWSDKYFGFSFPISEQAETYSKICGLKMGIYCPQGSGTFRQQYTQLYSVMLCYKLLCNTQLYSVILRYAPLYSVILCYTLFHSISLCFTLFNSVSLCFTLFQSV